MVDHTHALSFGAVADDYDRFRPTYPPDAVAWAVGVPAPARVVDLGAGTGILARAAAALGHRVTAVEPDDTMRARLVEASPGITALAGAAEAVPLPDGSADVVVAGTAYHWFDRERAHPELARLVRSGGAFAAIWNLRDESVDWVARLGDVAGAMPGYRGIRDELPDITSFGEGFDRPERHEFPHALTYTHQSLLGMVRTRSYYLTATEAERRRMADALHDLVTNHPDLAGRESFDLPYLTVVYRAPRH